MTETFCAAPFIQMTLQPSGRVSPCCYHYNHFLGDGREQSLTDIWNSAPIQKLRNEFLTGAIKTCRGRIKNQSCQKQFQRFEADIERAVIQQTPPRRLDVRLNGQCNLKCVMCEVWQAPNHVWDASTLWSELDSPFLEQLQEVEMLGGEPFIQQDTFRFIDAVRQGNPLCQWSFVTNAHYPFSKRLQAALSQIQIRRVQVSIDSFHRDTYQAIRGGDMALRDQCLGAWRQLAGDRGFDLVLSMCVLKHNWREVPAFIRTCQEWQLGIELQYAYYDPSHDSSLEYMSLQEKEDVLQFWRDQLAPEDWVHVLPIVTPLEYAVASARRRQHRDESVHVE